MRYDGVGQYVSAIYQSTVTKCEYCQRSLRMRIRSHRSVHLDLRENFLFQHQSLQMNARYDDGYYVENIHAGFLLFIHFASVFSFH